RLPLARSLASAIGYAHDGFPVAERLAGFIKVMHGDLAEHPESAALLLPDGTLPRAGRRLVSKDLARTLDAIATDGWSGFYEGPVAAEMARFATERGGFFAVSDFSKQKATWGEPLVGRYRDVTIYNTPPPTQGFTVIEMLNLVEPRDLSKLEFLGPDHIHLL